MDTLPFIVSLGGNIVAAVGVPWLLAKLAGSRMDRLALEEANKGLRKAIAEMKPDAERGRKNRVALDKANKIRRGK